MADKDSQSSAVPLVDPARDAEPASRLMLTRSNAINDYARVELSLAMLLAQVLGVDMEAAGIIFFRIINTRSRNIILRQLLKKRFGDKYKTFWKSMEKLLRKIDQKRNEVVHWHVAHKLEMGKGPDAASEFELNPPNFWARDRSDAAHTPESLLSFSKECDFTCRLLNMFVMYISGNLGNADSGPWPEIFQQQVVYPPPRNHPLYQEPQSDEK